MTESSITEGRRVAVVRGMYRATDGSDVEVGEVGVVIGFRGIHDAVVDFETDSVGRSACIPIRMLRVVAQRREAR